jgi:hypothetical protein
MAIRLPAARAPVCRAPATRDSVWAPRFSATSGDTRWATLRSGRVQVGERQKNDGLEQTRALTKKSE